MLFGCVWLITVWNYQVLSGCGVYDGSEIHEASAYVSVYCQLHCYCCHLSWSPLYSVENIWAVIIVCIIRSVQRIVVYQHCTCSCSVFSEFVLLLWVLSMFSQLWPVVCVKVSLILVVISFVISHLLCKVQLQLQKNSVTSTRT